VIPDLRRPPLTAWRAERGPKREIADLSGAMLAQRDSHGVTNDAVPNALLQEITAQTAWGPSAVNTRPWHQHTLTGKLFKQMRDGQANRISSTGVSVG